MLGRDSAWRQGDLLADEAAASLGLVAAGDEVHRAVVISHDCDLPHDGEPFVEVIIANLVVKDPKPDPNLSYAKNPRRLHLTYEQAGGIPLVLELRHTERQWVEKERFRGVKRQGSSAILPADAKRALKQWLAARYGRPAFPNSFEDRLRKKVGKRTVDQQIGKILEPDSRHLVGLFFDLGELRDAEAPSDEPYVLSISVVYDSIDGGPVARHAAERVASSLQELFYRSYGSPEVATEIALEACEAVSDTHLTLADLRKVDQWRLEYISLRDGEGGDFLATGETPV